MSLRQEAIDLVNDDGVLLCTTCQEHGRAIDCDACASDYVDALHAAYGELMSGMLETLSPHDD